jgi:hypothetical protein
MRDDTALDLTPETYPLTLKLALARRQAQAQAHQDAAVKMGLAPFVPSPASTLYSVALGPHLHDSAREWEQGPEWAQDHRDGDNQPNPNHAPNPAALSQGDAAWERALAQERATMAAFWGDCDGDSQEPEAGAERRTPSAPAPRSIALGATLEGGLVNVHVPSDSTDATHIVTCRRLRKNGVDLYVGLDCTCKDFSYRKKKTALNPNMIPAPCKHIKAAQAFARKQAVERIFTQGTKQ